MHEIETLLMSLIAVVALVAFARRINISYPILLVLGGLGLGFVPGLPSLELTPDLIFLLFLPPLLLAEAWFTSWRDFSRNSRPIGLLAFGLVLTTTASVALVAHWLIPGFPLPAAFVLGAIAAPTDAVAVSAIGEKLSLPRKILVILSGESLINDATALVAYRTAVAAVVTGAFSLSGATLNFVVASAGGVGVGLAMGYAMAWIIERTKDSTLGITISLLAPYIAYLPAERLHFSGVLATVVAGLYMGRQNHRIMSAKQRTQGEAFWQVLVFLLNGLLFILVGFQLHGIVASLSYIPLSKLAWYATAISLTVILTRIGWVIPATYIPRALSQKIRDNEPRPAWRNVAIVAWSGARGGVSLASALAIPLTIQNGTPFPQRDMILFLTYGIIFFTLVVQGLSLPPLINLLHVESDGFTREEERYARRMATHGALRRIKEVAGPSGLPDDIIDDFRGHMERRLHHLKDLADEEEQRELQESKVKYTEFKQEILTAQREIIVELRDTNTIGDDAMHRILRDLDLEELRIHSGDEDDEH